MSPTSETIRIVLADDHHLVRAGIKSLIEETDSFRVVGECGNGAEAVRLVDEFCPDVALLDVAMDGMSGLQALEEIGARHPETRVVMLSMYDSEEHVIAAMRAGAAGYVLKNAAPHELPLAIKAVIGGGTWLSASISRHVIDTYLERMATTGRQRDELTPRQRQVLKMIADGMRPKEIGFALGVSVKTVETYRAQLLKKLQVQETAGLVRYAIRHGISEL